MRPEYDVAVVGCGVMGAAALWRLAGRGARAIGFEQHEPGHALGSSHGRSRIIRTAYYEGPEYVPLLRSAFGLWRELEREAGVPLLTLTGGVTAGRPDSALVAGVLRSARAHGLEHELLDAEAAVKRFPHLRPAGDEAFVFEAAAGVLRPTESLLAMVAAAESAGAEVRRRAQVTAVRPVEGGVEIEAAETTALAGHAVVAVGSWLGTFLPATAAVAVPERQVAAWFALSEPERWRPELAPVFMYQLDDGVIRYGFPSQDGATAKIGVHHDGLRGVHPDRVDRAVAAAELDPVREFAESRLRGVTARVGHAEVCLYTNTPDEHFLVGPAPGLDRVTLLGGFSGHGFKFAPVIGEVAADLALTGFTRHPIAGFAPARFGGA